METKRLTCECNLELIVEPKDYRFKQNATRFPCGKKNNLIFLDEAFDVFLWGNSKKMSN